MVLRPDTGANLHQSLPDTPVRIHTSLWAMNIASPLIYEMRESKKRLRLRSVEKSDLKKSQEKVVGKYFKKFFRLIPLGGDILIS